VTPGRFISRASAAPIRLGPAAGACLHAGAGEQPLLQDFVGEFRRQRPRESGGTDPREIVLDGGARKPERSPDLARAHPLVMKADQVS
jgi:hypothetical protein